MRRLLALAVVAAVLLLSPLTASTASAQMDARMLRFPDVSEAQIAFVYAGDIWVADKAGGVAHRLSTPSGEESFPRFSPDGSRIAFTGNYDGNVDVYVVPSTGGATERLTYHPMPDRMLEWYADGESILFASWMSSEKNRFRKLYRVSASGGLAEKLPVPYGEFGAVSADGGTLAYMPISRDFRTWKRYRGGMAPEIWLFDLEDYSSRNISQNLANDGHPMWHGETLYFLSDRDENQRHNIWAYDLDSGDARQITHFEDFDVRFPAIGPSELVFEAGGRLYLLDLATEQQREVQVEVVTDRSTLKPRAERVAGLIQSGDISPNGKRAVFEARGDVFTVPAEKGFVRNLTRDSGTAERSPAWSPDGKWIAYWSDRTGEYELVLQEADGSGEPETITELGQGFRYSPHWSPDSEKIAFIDQTMTIHVLDVESRAVTDIDQGLWMFHGALANFRVSWSPDSRWIAYARGLESRHPAVFLFDTETGERHQVTSGFYGEFQPAFDPDGKYLYVLTARNIAPTYGDFDNTFVYPNSTQVAAIPLRDDVPSPLAPRNDEEEVEDDKAADGDNGDDEAEDGDDGDEATDDDSDDEDADAEDAEEDSGTEIDLDGFERRLVVLPPDAGNYADLYAVSGKVLYRRMPRSGSGDGPSPIAFWDLDDREEKTVIGDADGYALSANGKKILLISNGTFAIVNAAPGQEPDKPLRMDLEMTVDPVAEWRQIFNDVFRLQRDFFYDQNMHGVNWESMGERYSALLADAVTRWDINFIIGELIAELNAGHTYRGGGDLEQSEQRSVGMLGVDFEVADGAYRIAKIIRGAPWDSEVRSPFDQPGVEIDEGDFILAVNGIPLDTGVDPYAAFQGLAGDVIEVTVNDRATRDGARSVLVEALGTQQEMRLRNLEWINANRIAVAEATDGQIGYIYVPDTGINGQNELLRQFAAQIHTKGLIIDERFNSGGQIPDRFVEMLNRPLYSYWGVRDGKDWQWPPIAHNGPKVMLMNGWSGSGGDAFPLFFKHAGVGPLIGTRTWGGLIGISGAPALVDGGGVTVPTFGIYSLEGEWIVEGHGVDPDIEVLEDPTLMAQGRDPQLERAIEEVLRMLRENPPVEPNRPAPPDRSGR